MKLYAFKTVVVNSETAYDLLCTVDFFPGELIDALDKIRKSAEPTRLRELLVIKGDVIEI